MLVFILCMCMKKSASSLETELRKRNITFYKLLKKLGRDPRADFGSVVRRIRGTTPMSSHELFDICMAIEDLSGKPFDPNTLRYEVEAYRLK